MERVILTTGMILIAAAAVAVGTTRTPESKPESKPQYRNGVAAVSPSHASESLDPQRVERGKYLVSIIGCNDCHTPFKMGPTGPEPDMTRMLSGHPQGIKLTPPSNIDRNWMLHGSATNTAFAGPWGISYAANLTPDHLTGLGIWTEQNFVNALRRGKHWGEARPIMPPMPWQAFSNMTDEDLKSIFAYLRTIPPVSNQVPDYEPPAAK